MHEPITFSTDEILSVHKTVGRNVKKHRELKGLSQLQLSHAIGYSSVSLVSAAELVTKGIHFNIEHLYKISKVLDVELCKLIKLND